jgi:hypothetical protein
MYTIIIIFFILFLFKGYRLLNIIILSIFIIIFKYNNISLLNYIINNITDVNYNLLYFNLILLLNYFIFKKNKNNKIIIVSLLIFFFFYNERFINYNFYKNIFFFKKNLETLSNGLFFIHPIILYVGYINYIYFFVLNKLFLKSKKIFIFYFFILALILGGWWASQELN